MDDKIPEPESSQPVAGRDLQGDQKGASTQPKGQPTSHLRVKLLRVMLGIVAPLTVAMVSGAGVMQYRTTLQASHAVEDAIRDAIRDKGRVTAENHAMALAVLVAENAFGDVQELIRRSVQQDPDVVYGLFVSADGTPWAYVAPNVPDAKPEGLTRWRELAIPPDQLHPERVSERNPHLFEQPIMEFAAPVRIESGLLGTVRYGLGAERMRARLAQEQQRTREALTATLVLLGALGLVTLILAALFVGRAARRISEPLAVLTAAANQVAEGRRDVCVTVNSGDELQILAGAFNDMARENQRSFEQLEETTQRALEAARLKTEFLANMSHEIRTPMNGVIGMVRLMLDMPLGGKLRRYTETIDTSAQALLTVIDDVLDFSKMEAGKYTIVPMPFEPRLVVQDVCELHAPRAHANGVELVYRVASDVPAWIIADPYRFRQVLNNLVGNAVKFTSSGEVFIELQVEAQRTHGPVLRISVIDTGMGISPADITKIFEAFSQADGSLVRQHGGTGLGLAIGKRLVEMMGGTIDVWSRPGLGSQFWFTLPAQNAPENPLRARRTHDLPTGKRVIVVEANRRWGNVIAEHCKAWGLNCDVFHSADRALEAVRKATERGAYYDIAVVGSQAGSLGMKDVVQQIAELSEPRVPIIALTHGADKPMMMGDFEQWLVATLPQPLRMSDLYNAVQEAITGQSVRPKAPQKGEEPQRYSGCRVLVVEDNLINQFVATEQLEAAGFAVDLADNGAAGVDKARENAYSIIFMDCQMPLMDGYTATREIRALEEGTDEHRIIVALTAHALVGERERVLSAGMDDFLTKPLSRNALERMLRRYVQAPIPEQTVGQALLVSAANDPQATTSELPDKDDGLVTEAAAQSNPIGHEPPVLASSIVRSPTLIELCLKETPKQLQALADALSESDSSRTRAMAHKIKGGCLAIGAETMADIAETLQHLAEQKLVDEARELAPALSEEFVKVRAALERELTSRRAS